MQNYIFQANFLCKFLSSHYELIKKQIPQLRMELIFLFYFLLLFFYVMNKWGGGATGVVI